MFAALILIVSLGMMAQFGICYWRALMAGAASEPLSDGVRVAIGIEDDKLGPEHFGTVMELHEICAALAEADDGFLMARVYYAFVAVLGKVARRSLPSLAAWASREMTTCSRYAAVMLDRRLERDLECAEVIRY